MLHRPGCAGLSDMLKLLDRQAVRALVLRWHCRVRGMRHMSLTQPHPHCSALRCPHAVLGEPCSLRGCSPAATAALCGVSVPARKGAP